jgi:hypothetical protein
LKKGLEVASLLPTQVVPQVCEKVEERIELQATGWKVKDFPTMFFKSRSNSLAITLGRGIDHEELVARPFLALDRSDEALHYLLQLRPSIVSEPGIPEQFACA